MLRPLLSRNQLASVAIVLLSGLWLGAAQGANVSLSGDEEVPPVKTDAKGSGDITIGPDRAVSGSITTTGISASASHIHEAGSGKNGPVILPLVKNGDNGFSVPPGAMLTESQYVSYKAGNLYVNVHSAAHPGGELRGQLSPP